MRSHLYGAIAIAAMIATPARHSPYFPSSGHMTRVMQQLIVVWIDWQKKERG